MKIKTMVLSALLFGCGDAPSNGDLNDLRNQVSALQLQTNTLDALVKSDFATCPASGDTSDPLVQKICQIAQASTVEARVELSSQMQNFVSALQVQIDAIANDAGDNSANIALLQAQIANIQSDILTLSSRMTNAENAITALQNLTASINGTVNGVMYALLIGEENLGAGPMYESLLKRVDNKRVNGYEEGIGSEVTVGNNALTATNGSPLVVVSSTAHGLSVNDVVVFTTVTSGRGFSSGHFARDLVVTATTTNTFTVNVGKNATSSGTFGGNAPASYHKVNGRGMSTLWKSLDASDSSVRTTNLGSKRYNFIIRRKASDVTNSTAEVCYDKTNNAATFATINAAPENGLGNVVCK